ncbi:FecR domain-containing protein [Rhodobacter capsulatus]|uniref:FecR domain-containing protein n=1 Tax=Rhodobacter capsulatus TaxID=1061 RepID=UPI0003D337D2|nr:FecR domain-containing protein [Rhodobacter capsulatus]ETD85509.1 FecR protein [Rhodobacter capsulatus YW1]
MTISRRLLLSLPAALALAPRAALAQAAIGTTRALTGRASLTRAGTSADLHQSDPLMEGDEIATMAASTAALELFTATRITLGPETRFTLDRFTADLGGVVSIGGAMVFDRPEDLPKLDLTVQGAFARIGVRGTRFFCGPSKGVYGIFVARGSVEVAAGGEIRRLGPGEGVDIARPGAAPGAVAPWKAPRIAAAFALVGLRP